MKLVEGMEHPMVPVMVKFLTDGEQQLSKLETLLMTANRQTAAKDATIAALRAKLHSMKSLQKEQPLMVSKETNTELKMDDFWLSDVNMF
jgi:hypothetical protein